MYSCGPTVYDVAHIGNLRAYVFNDVLYRTLVSFGYKVKWVMNITDIDDKTIKRAKEEGRDLKELTGFYFDKFKNDLQKLNVSVDEIKFVKATENIDVMKEMVNDLVEKGFAYEADDGIYFDVSKLPEYGEMAGVNVNQNESKSRIDNDNYDKESAQDFALWKKDAGYPEGRPGWHIECSAMAQKYLGVPFDIHTGGVDLIFPHHTNEMAQTKASTGKSLANFWLHNEHLLVDGQKMAKSEGNYITLDTVIEKGFSPLALRLELMKAHYRSKLDFSWKSLESSQELLMSWRRLASNCAQYSSNEVKSYPPERPCRAGQPSVSNNNDDFPSALSDDLRMPKVISVISATTTENCADLVSADKILGLDLVQSIPEDIKQMLIGMDNLRQNGDFQKSDELRHDIESKGYVVENTPKGSVATKK